MRTGIFLVLLALLGAPATAQSWRGYDGVVQPLDRLLPGIRHAHPGKFYDAEGPWRGPDGQMHYLLKWMQPNGRLVWFDTDARTGRVLGVTEGGAPNFYRGPNPYPAERSFDPYGGGPGYGGPVYGRDHGDYGHDDHGHGRHDDGGGHHGDDGGHRHHGQ